MIERNIHIPNSAPSIGSIDLSYDPIGDRVRQINTSIITNPYLLSRLLYTADEFSQAFYASRRSIRTLIENEQLLNCSRIAAQSGYTLEAQIPLTGELGNNTFAYFGRNSKDRLTSNYIRKNEQKLIREVLKKDRKNPSQVIAKVLQKGFSLERLRGSLSKQDHQSLIAMYEHSFTSYPFDIAKTIQNMVADDQTVVYAARSQEDRSLHALCAAEQVVVPLTNGQQLLLWEMGDSARLESGKGLNGALKLRIVREAARNNVSLLFCESRAALKAINTVNHSIGMEFGGSLVKHTVIGGVEDVPESAMDGTNGRFGNMNVWYLNKGQIFSLGLPTYQEENGRENLNFDRVLSP
jgi:hypothetical protein